MLKLLDDLEWLRNIINFIFPCLLCRLYWLHSVHQNMYVLIKILTRDAIIIGRNFFLCKTIF